MKRFFVWLFTDALSVEVDGVRYVVDWTAVGAVAGAVAAAVGLAAIWYSIHALRRQLRHQSELEAKQLEQNLLIRVIDLAQVPYDGSHDFIADAIAWRLYGGPARNPEFLAQAARKAVEAHRQLSTATASALSVLRRSRPRRFPRGVQDRALEQYDDLIQKVVAENGRMLQYSAGDFNQFDMAQFQETVGSDAFDIANALRRATGELLTRMYSEDDEWQPFTFREVEVDAATGRVGFDFFDDPPLGRA